MRKLKVTRLACLVLAFLFLVSTATIAISADSDSGVTDKSIKDYADELNTITYQNYMSHNSELFLNYKDANTTTVEFDATANWKFTDKSGNTITIAGDVWTMTVGKGNEQVTYTSVEAAVEAGFKKEELVYVAEFDGKKGVYTPGVGEVEWTLDLAAAGVTAAGLYNIQLLYYPVSGKSAAIEREFYINGDAPFAEARALRLAKLWSSLKPDATSPLTATYRLDKKDDLATILAEAVAAGVQATASEDGASITFTRPTVVTQANYEFAEKYSLRFFIVDAENNELRPTMVQTPAWTTYTMHDGDGFFANNFGFVIEPRDGKVTFSMEGVNESMALAKIVLTPYNEVQTYKDYINGLGDLANSQNGGLRRIDDGHEFVHIEHTQGGDSEGAAMIILVSQLAVAGLFDELSGLGGNAAEANDVGVTDHRDDQAAGNGNSGAHIDIVVIDDVVAVHRCVDDGIALEGLGAGADDDIVVGDLDAQSLVLAAQGDGGGHIHSHAGAGLGVGILAGQHIVGDGLAHTAHALGAGAAGDLTGRCGSLSSSGGSDRSGCGLGAGQIGSGDLAAHAGAGDAGQVDALCLCHIGSQGSDSGLVGHIA